MNTSKILIAAGMLNLVLGGSLISYSYADDAHHHDHGAPAQLTLNNGQKWQTDEPLRLGMQRLQHLSSSMSIPAQAATLAEGVHEQVSFLINNCELEPAADAVLHVLIADLLRGADLLTDQSTTSDGANLISHALEVYPQYFDHPGWQAEPHAH